MGVFENVEVMGKSGADLETELLHHEESPDEPDATPADATPPAEPQPPAADPEPLG